MRFSRLFPDNAAFSQTLCVVCCIAGLLSLVSGVVITVQTFGYAQLLGACLGVGLLLGGVFLIEFARWLEMKVGGRDKQESAVEWVSGPKVGEIAIETAVVQAIVILLFGLFLDNGVRQRACLYSCLGYWAGAAIVFVRRRNTLTRGDRFYLRWGWLPILVIGTWLFIRMWKYKGLI